MSGDATMGMLPASGGVGTAFNYGIGAALAKKLQRQSGAALITCGDGGSNRGDIHEGMNFASVFGLPAVFLFVNNGWAISVKSDFALSVDRISKRAAGYSIPGITVDGRDVVKVHEAVSGALKRARNDEGPALVEVMVNRWSAHSANDPDIYRTDEERTKAREIDPLRDYEAILEARGLVDETYRQAVHDEIMADLDAAIDYAESCTEPGYNAMTFGVYKESS
jgi:TPP-dependent pyruvate/acetoin dehydrogenase alpha subunit